MLFKKEISIKDYETKDGKFIINNIDKLLEENNKEVLKYKFLYKNYTKDYKFGKITFSLGCLLFDLNFETNAYIEIHLYEPFFETIINANEVIDNIIKYLSLKLNNTECKRFYLNKYSFSSSSDYGDTFEAEKNVICSNLDDVITRYNAFKNKLFKNNELIIGENILYDSLINTVNFDIRFYDNDYN